MISGVHVVVYSKDAAADRLLFRDVLRFPCVDAGEGWLIFALPPAETAFHPSQANGPHEMYFTCKNLKKELARLAKKGARFSPVKEETWGSLSMIRLPGGGQIGLYQPKHPIAQRRASKRRTD